MTFDGTVTVGTPVHERTDFAIDLTRAGKPLRLTLRWPTGARPATLGRIGTP